MFLIGIIVTVGLCILGVNSYLTNLRVQKATDQTILRNQHIETVSDIEHYHLILMLDAMDSVVDKDEGKIQAKRMTSITKNIEHIHDRLTELDQLAEHDEEKRLAQGVRSNFQNLSKAIETELVQLVENKASKEEFAEFDDQVDQIGSQIGADLAAISDSVQNEQNKANEELSEVMSRSSLVERLAMLVEGTGKNNGRNRNVPQVAGRKGPLKARKPTGLKSALKTKSIDYEKINPEQIIPFDDDDFSDF